jgi:predicted RNA-binding protein YlxR (DUF448 family)
MKQSKHSHAGHIPLRTCVGCRRVREKTHLLRIVRRNDGTVAIDRKGTAPGRGAYLCPDPACLKLAHKRGALERSFRAHVPESVYLSLAELLVNTHGTD